VALASTIPGVARRTAEVLVAEIGTDMSNFPSARHLASWAGRCPGNDQSAGKRRSGRTRKGSKWLGIGLQEAALAAIRSKNTYLAAQYQRLKPRLGHGRALGAASWRFPDVFASRSPGPGAARAVGAGPARSASAGMRRAAMIASAWTTTGNRGVVTQARRCVICEGAACA
jgi:hypothetical protein